MANGGMTMVSRAALIRAVARIPSVVDKSGLGRVLYYLAPKAILTADGRISGAFLPHFCRRLAGEVLPGSYGAGLEERAGEIGASLEAMGAADSASPLDTARAYDAMVRDRLTITKLVETGKNLKDVIEQYATLQRLVLEVGTHEQTNREIAVRCIREVLGYSGVRVYSVDKKGNWQHQYAGGEKGPTRFSQVQQPDINSEKGHINRLLKGEIAPEIISQARRQGWWEWAEDPAQAWATLYIPNRKNCDFVEKKQLAMDEQGHGKGAAREILYLVAGKREEGKPIEVYMITNWAANAPLFNDKQQELGLLQAFAASITHSKALEELEARAVTDPLTRLYNRRFFDERIKIEVARARRYGHPISLLMVDIDYFKGVNDTYGHLAGDAVLRQVAAIIQGVTREPDIAARYGGEEIAVILPETDGGPTDEKRRSGTSIAGNRLRQRVAAAAYDVGSGKSIKVTVSVGCASEVFPEPAGSESEVEAQEEQAVEQIAAGLIARADSALYAAKKGGRNQVRESGPAG